MPYEHSFTKDEQNIIDKVFNTPLSEIMLNSDKPTEPYNNPYSDDTVISIEEWVQDALFNVDIIKQ